MKIALDVFGGDSAPEINIQGAIDYLNFLDDKAANIILVGNKKVIESYLTSYDYNKSKIDVLHTTEVITMNEKPSRIFREKPNSSMVKAIELVKNQKADAILSAGNTGALLTSSLFLIGKIPGVRRPAFAPFIPTKNGGFILCDAGANAESKPNHLLQFSLMASAYIEHLNNVHQPKVGLLNIGKENNKGNELYINTNSLLDKYIDNFIGNIESRYILDGKVDIVICDGFTGNIVLKLTEGLFSHMLEWFHDLYSTYSNNGELSDEFLSIFMEIKNALDPEEYGSTPLLGINGLVMKCHGSTSARGIKNSLIVTQKALQKNLITDITTRLSKYIKIFDNKNISEATPI